MKYIEWEISELSISVEQHTFSKISEVNLEFEYLEI